MPVQLSVDQQALQALTRALKAEADGKKLRRELAKNLRQALDPAKGEIVAGLMSVGSGEVQAEGEPLRTAVAKQIKAEARLTGRSTGARMRARRTPDVRGFTHAPKRLNSRKGWRRRIFGTDRWVVQLGKPGYFDDPLERRHGEYRQAVLDAMEDLAKRIAARVKTR